MKDAGQWFNMCVHMMNENPTNFFLMPYQDKTGNAKFAKAYKVKAEDRIQWAWDTITGKAKSPASVGFYPTNVQRQSRWAAMDFDIQDDDQMRARNFALKAFATLYRQPQLFIALTTSAGDPERSGWHLFIFTADFFPCDEWTIYTKDELRLLVAHNRAKPFLPDELFKLHQIKRSFQGESLNEHSSPAIDTQNPVARRVVNSLR